MPSAWERMCELKAGSDLIRRVNRARDKFVEIDPAATAEEKLLSSSVRAYTSGIASSPQSTDNYYKRGYVQFMHKEYESAIHDFSRAVEINPQYADAWSARGNCYFMTGKIHLAINDFRQAVDVNPALSDCYYNLGNAEFELGHHEESILMFTRAIAIDLEFAAAYNNRATVFKLVDQHEKAIDDLTSALEQTDATTDIADKVSYRLNRGDAYMKLDMYPQAIEDLTEAIDLDATCADAMALRCGAFVATGRFMLAEKDGISAVELSPECAQALYYRGQARHSLGRHDEALLDLGQAIECCGDKQRPEYQHMRGAIRDALGDTAGATEDFCASLHLQPSLHQKDIATREKDQDPELLDATRRRNEVTIAHATDQIKGGNSNGEVYLARGEAYLLKGEYCKAMTDIATQLSCEQPATAALAAYWAGRVQQEQQAYDEAGDFFGRALGVGSAAGVNTIILSNVAMAEVLLATDRADKSLEHAIAATEMNLNSAQAHAVKGRCLLRLSVEDPALIADALAALDAAIALDSKCNIAFATRRQARYRGGELAAAFQDYQTATALDPKLIGQTAELVMATVQLHEPLGSTQRLQPRGSLIGQQTALMNQ